MLAVLRQRDYRLMLFGLGVSGIGSLMLYVTLPFYIYLRTRSVLATGGMFIAQVLPRIVFGSIAGVLVDRWPARRTMIAGDLLRALVVLPLLLVRSVDTLWIVYAVMIAEGCVHQVFGSSFNASLPRLVGPQHLPAANAVNHISGSIEGLIAPALGGAVLLTVGLPAIVALDTASYLFSAVLLAMISIPGVVRETSGQETLGLKREWLEGIRLAGRRASIRNLLLFFGMLALAQGMWSVLFVPFANGVLGANALQYGFMVSVRGVGGLLGGLAAGSIVRRVQAGRLWPMAYAGFGVTLIAQLVIRAIQPVTALMIPAGLFANLGIVSGRTLLMTAFPDQHRGRLFGVWESFTGILLILGMAVASFFAKPIGVVPTYAGAAVVLLVTSGLAAVLLGRSPASEVRH